MAMPYRPIKPALSNDGSFRKGLQDRTAPKRTGMIKSACWECRKRKAKCNGLKPTCANCAKSDAECIYDSDIRDAKVRHLQIVNERLEAEVEAAKTLLKQVALGPDQIRSIVLELLQDAKEPLEILKVLTDNGGINSTMETSQMPHVTSHLPTEGVFHGAEYFNTSASTSANSSFGQSLVAPTSLYQSSLDSAGHITGHPNSLTVGSLSHQPPHQSEAQSLFFEPLFDHDDFLLTATPNIPGPSPHNGHRQSTIHTETKTQLMHEGSDGSPPSTVSHSDTYTSTQTTIQMNSEEPLTPSLAAHPNFRNHFNNLSLSSSIRANGYPRTIQEAQIRNIFVPDWAAASLNTIPDPGHLEDAFGDIYKKATSLLKSGEPSYRIIGHHPNIAALYDQHEFDRSCLLSQWAARMVHSVKRKGYDFTCFASMNVFWYMMRWMVDPSPDSYAAMPEWIRPTSNQLFTPHISMADFVLWPGFRDLVVQLPQLQERMEWLADMSLFIKCDWPYPLEQALHRNPISGNVDLVDLAKQHIWTLGCWSVGPSFRRFVPHADSYLLVRPEEEPV